ncbi:MAG: hypothetical protein V2I33_01745 [Kangiellaceae bacterium]|nr:hypothetical protein [Kangiellaceae bacterium]
MITIKSSKIRQLIINAIGMLMVGMASCSYASGSRELSLNSRSVKHFTEINLSSTNKALHYLGSTKQ